MRWLKMSLSVAVATFVGCESAPLPEVSVARAKSAVSTASDVVARVDGIDITKAHVKAACDVRWRDGVVDALVDAQLFNRELTKLGRGDAAALARGDRDALAEALDPVAPPTQRAIEDFYAGYPTLWAASTKRVLRERNLSRPAEAPQTLYMGPNPAVPPQKEWEELEVGDESKEYVRDGSARIATCVWLQHNKAVPKEEAMQVAAEMISTAQRRSRHAALSVRLREGVNVETFGFVSCPSKKEAP